MGQMIFSRTDETALYVQRIRDEQSKLVNKGAGSCVILISIYLQKESVHDITNHWSKLDTLFDFCTDWIRLNCDNITVGIISFINLL